MALFGDFGKIFLGGATTGDVGAAVGEYFGSREAGRTVGEGLAGLSKRAGSLAGMNERVEQGQSVAVSQATQTKPQETQQSGSFGANVSGLPAPTMQAGFGLAAPLTQLARKFAPEIGIGLGVGAVTAAAPTIIDAFGEPRKMRVTRKMQRTLKQVVDQFGIQGAMELTGLDQNTIMFIYTKKFRNDGPYVTKAAVRKTRQTVRKMKNLCDMYDDLRPAAKRRAPVRRTGMTKITQVK